MKPIQSGRLNKRITIEEDQGTAVEDSNEHIEDWKAIATVWAGFLDQHSGREYALADQQHAEVTHQIEIRYRPGLNSKMRVMFGTRKFEIVSIANPQERNIKLILNCKETT